MSTLLLPARLLRFARYVVPAGSSAKIAERLFRRATAARNAGQYLAAGILYEEALRFTPGLGRIHVQAGHMFKEAGDFQQAEHHYRCADALLPGDADLALQFGHFHKLAGRLDDAIAAYARALDLQPGWADAADELARLEHGRADRLERTAERAAGPIAAGQDAGILTELLPRGADDVARTRREGLVVHHLGGRRERTPSGMMTTLRGIEAVRGSCISAVPVTALEILLDDLVLHSAVPDGIATGPAGGDRRKYVFNVWLDVSAVPSGRYEMEVRCTDARGRVRSHRQHVLVAPPQPEAAYPDSDAFVAIDPVDPRSVVEQVNARHSMIRVAERSLLPHPPRAILVQRVDQLGDLVASVPAIRRLRTLAPQARLVGLLSPANVDLARTLDLFDAIVVADYPEDPRTGRRSMSAEAQRALRDALAAHDLDIAIDLCANGGSRPLLLLSGAPFLYGFRAAEAPWLTADATGMTADPVNGHESASHSARVLALVEWLGAIIARPDAAMPRPDGSRDGLRAYGLAPDDCYVLLHVGARLAFSRWPHFGALAALLLARTDLHVVVMADTAEDAAAQLPAASDRLHVVTGRIPFADFDALLSCAAVFVGNDSGPKHLAALRGTPVVSLHMARLNWNEWGQSSGLIVSRRVPCAGCGIHAEPEDCGQGFACITHILPEEVYGAVRRLLP